MFSQFVTYCAERYWTRPLLSERRMADLRLTVHLTAILASQVGSSPTDTELACMAAHLARDARLFLALRISLGLLALLQVGMRPSDSELAGAANINIFLS